MKKINFTQEHESRLKVLTLELLFNGTVITGIAGSKYTIYDLLHEVTLNTLSTMYSNLKREIEKIENTDEWSMTDYQQKKLAETKSMRELINLIIGWRKHQSQIQSDKAKVKEMKAKLKEIEKSSMTPEEQAKELKDAIRAMGGDPDADDEE